VGDGRRSCSAVMVPEAAKPEEWLPGGVVPRLRHGAWTQAQHALRQCRSLKNEGVDDQYAMIRWPAACPDIWTLLLAEANGSVRRSVRSWKNKRER